MDRHRVGLSRAPRTEPPLRPCHPTRHRGQPESEPPASRICRTGRTGTTRPPADRHTAADSAAQQFAERALRLALEIFDHRRPVTHLAALAEPTVVSRVRTLVRADLAPGRKIGAATLARVHVVATDASNAEVCASYVRADRHFAVAAHIVHTRVKGWRLSALRLF
ncbi:Rv3235 family protein [Nocardia australiensis]|uniref:Rv3235 family protein n=1 Tax=Nocardia australiensis TaxID=2887191 RepID=UPI001D1479D5|nr:Rv3235 family protein [Nocardia australiensis]